MLYATIGNAVKNIRETPSLRMHFPWNGTDDHQTLKHATLRGGRAAKHGETMRELNRKRIRDHATRVIKSGATLSKLRLKCSKMYKLFF